MILRRVTHPELFNEVFFNSSTITKYSIYRLCEEIMELTGDGFKTHQYLASLGSVKYHGTIESLFKVYQSQDQQVNFFIHEVAVGDHSGDNFLTLMLRNRDETFLIQLFRQMTTEDLLNILDRNLDAIKENSQIQNYTNERLSKENNSRANDFSVSSFYEFEFETLNRPEEKKAEVNSGMDDFASVSFAMDDNFSTQSHSAISDFSFVDFNPSSAVKEKFSFENVFKELLLYKYQKVGRAKPNCIFHG